VNSVLNRAGRPPQDQQLEDAWPLQLTSLERSKGHLADGAYDLKNRLDEHPTRGVTES
jgi:hypothetical protein